MSKLKAQSQFRFAQCKEVKGQAYDGVKLSDPSPTSSCLSASGKWIAAGVGDNKGNIGLFPLNFAQYQKKADPPVIGAHSGPLADIQFSPFDDGLLASAGKDGLVKLWNIPAEGITANVSQPAASWGEYEGLSTLAWHPTAGGVIAAGGRKSLTIFDANEAKGPKWSYTFDGFNKDIQSVCWNYNGSQLAAVGKNNVVHLLDPRSADAKSALEAGAALGDLRPQCGLYVGNNNVSLLLLGLDKMRNPMYSLYDTRNMAKAADSKTLSFSTGFLLPMYDIDTELLMLSVRGSLQVTTFDLSQGALDQVGSYSFKSGLKGATLARKHALDIYNMEVNRIIGLTDKAIEPVTMTVTRKNPGFHAELYPPTAVYSAPTLTADTWAKGANDEPKLYQIVDPIAEARKATTAEVAQQKQQEAVDKKTAARTYNATSTRKNLEAVFANTVFKHTKSHEPNSKDLMHYMLQTYGKTLPMSRNIRVNNTYFAFPWKTVGGSALCVLPIAKPGRCPETPLLVRGHKAQFNTFDLSPFDSDLLISGGDEGKALVFRMPAGGKGLEKDDLEKPIYEIETEGKVTLARFHPFAADVVVTVSVGLSASTVQFWPIGGADVKPAPKVTLPEHKEPIWDVSFCPDGFTVATTSRDGKTRLFNTRDQKLIAEFAPDEGQRDTQVLWVNTHTLLVLGFGKMSRRSMSLYDTADLTKATKQLELSSSTAFPLAYYDEDSCLLFLANHGGRIMQTYNITPKTAPFIDPLSEWMTPSDLIGWAFFPKTTCDVTKVEVARCVKLTKDSVVPVSFLVPRKRMEYFQDDIFVPTRSPDAWFTAAEWFSGSAKEATFVSLQPAGMTELSKAPKEELTAAQKKYQDNLEAMRKAKEAQPKGATGHTNATEVNKYFSQVATTMPTKNRWDAAVDNSKEDVADDEW